MKTYLKVIVHAVAAVLAAVLPLAITNHSLSSSEWVNVAIASVGALTVYFGPNVPGAQYTKGILAALAAGLTVLSSVITDGVSQGELVQILVAVAGAFGVFGVKNSPPLYPATDKVDNGVL